jgi:transposase
MSLGRRKEKQAELFIPATQIAKGSGHPFYSKLNDVLAQSRFDALVEELCEPFYEDGGRPGIPPGVYFRMLFIGYFEGISSQRGIAWRCADSLALRGFLGYPITEATPVHASMTLIRQRLSEDLFDRVFSFTLETLNEGGFLKGKAFGVDATTLEANAAMKSIVRRDNGASWKEFLTELAKAEGMENPSNEDLRRLDRKRKGKKTSNKEWKSATDPDSLVTKMKDGRTHLAYKAEHTVQLESQAIVSALVTHADRGDCETCPESMKHAQKNLSKAGAEAALEELVADKGYHSIEMLAHCGECEVRTYIPERQQKRKWTDKAPEAQSDYRANRSRTRGAKGKRLNRQRSERVERTFAHVCETGGSPRSWLRGLENVRKIHKIKCGAYNLGLYMRRQFGMRKPRNWDEGRIGRQKATAGLAVVTAVAAAVGFGAAPAALPWLLALATATILIAQSAADQIRRPKLTPFKTGC